LWTRISLHSDDKAKPVCRWEKFFATCENDWQSYSSTADPKKLTSMIHIDAEKCRHPIIWQ
ncbi:hypothetical protein AMECASPLE_000175, partial [Ameca splendens]